MKFAATTGRSDTRVPPLAVLTAAHRAARASANNPSTAGAGGDAHHPGRRRQPHAGRELQPFLDRASCTGTQLIYEPLEIPSPIDGTYTPFLATGHKFSDPKTLSTRSARA